MIFVNNKYDLDYYSGKPAELCYCDYLVSASDMYLQGSWRQNTYPYTASVEVWSVDGNNIFEVVDPSMYEIGFFIHPFTLFHAFTFRLKSYTDAMCTQKCFLMRIGIRNAQDTIVFAGYTERYCIASCCESVGGVTVKPDGNLATQVVLPASNNYPQGDCGTRLIRMAFTSNCWNPLTGEYYGIPARLLGGDFVQYVSISTFKGKLVSAPREISREYSYNCKIQRIESTKQYNLVGKEAFPAWKMDELSSNFACSTIHVDDFSQSKLYEYYGGTPFEKIDISCYDAFKLNITLAECVTRQIFGCATTCLEQDNTAFFAISDSYEDGMLFFDGSGNQIADSIEGLVQWFQSNGMNASIVALSVPPCSYAGIISVTGGVIPQSIYFNNLSYQTQVNALYVPIENICDYLPVQCVRPVILSIVDSDIPCDAPMILSVVDSDIAEEELILTATTPWIADPAPDSEAYVYQNNVLMNISEKRVAVGLTGETYTVDNEQVASVSAQGVPFSNKILNSDNSNMPANQTLMIDTYGRIFFSGDIVLVNDNEIEINLTNIAYALI